MNATQNTPTLKQISSEYCRKWEVGVRVAHKAWLKRGAGGVVQELRELHSREADPVVIAAVENRLARLQRK